MTIFVVFEMLRHLRNQENRKYSVGGSCKATHVVNYSIGSSWKVRNVLSSRLCTSWKTRHTANNSYLVMQAHCKTNRSKGCKKLRVLIFVAAPPQPPCYFVIAKTNSWQKLVRSDLRPCCAKGAQPLCRFVMQAQCENQPINGCKGADVFVDVLQMGGLRRLTNPGVQETLFSHVFHFATSCHISKKCIL